MYKMNTILIWVGALLLLFVTACGTQTDLAATGGDEAGVVRAAAETAVEAPAEPAVEPTVISSVVNTTTVDEAAAANSVSHEVAAEYEPDDTAATDITLTGETMTVTGEGVTVSGRIATITSAGVYTLSGSLNEGQIVVDTADEEAVQLIFNGINITNSTTAPIYVANAEETIIVLPEGSDNYVTDGANYVFASAEEDEPNAAVFSKDDLTIYGEGSLTVQANYNDGIASKNGLIIASGNITVNAADDGIRGKDYLIIKDGTFNITAQGDGFKSDEENDLTLGYITIEGGVINITSGGDAIQAVTDVLISDGVFSLTSGGGSNATLAADLSAKALKGAVNVTIEGGSFTLNAADDAIHSNDSVIINNGTFTIASGDDGVHADAKLVVNGGLINVTQSYEGLESAVIAINSGEIYVVSSDDGINVAGGNDGSGFGGGGRGPGGGGQGPGGGGQDTFTEYTGDYYLYINGGYIVVDAGGDGLDANGAIEMTAGTVIVNGPTAQMNGALDYDGTFTMSGGFLVAAGSAGMAQTADVSSTQNALLLNFNAPLEAGTLIHIQDSNGNDVLTFAPTKPYQSIAFSSPELSRDMTYTVYYGGTATGTITNGLYADSSYGSGTEYTSFTVADTVTLIGNTGRR